MSKSSPASKPLQARIGEVTERIVKRSQDARRRYLDRIEAAAGNGPTRKKLGCANFAHGFAACGPEDKDALRDGDGAEPRHRHRL